MSELLPLSDESIRLDQIASVYGLAVRLVRALIPAEEAPHE